MAADPVDSVAFSRRAPGSALPVAAKTRPHSTSGGGERLSNWIAGGQLGEREPPPPPSWSSVLLQASLHPPGGLCSCGRRRAPCLHLPLRPRGPGPVVCGSAAGTAPGGSGGRKHVDGALRPLAYERLRQIPPPAAQGLQARSDKQGGVWGLPC